MSEKDLKELRSLTRQHLSLVWQMAQLTDVGSDLETTNLIKALKEHPEYHSIWDRLEEYGNEDIEIDGVNPILHINIHATIENQLAANAPPFVSEALRELMRHGVDRHEAVHAIGAALAEQIYVMLSTQQEYDEAKYREDVQRYAAEWIEQQAPRGRQVRLGGQAGINARKRGKKKRVKRARRE